MVSLGVYFESKNINKNYDLSSKRGSKFIRAFRTVFYVASSRTPPFSSFIFIPGIHLFHPSVLNGKLSNDVNVLLNLLVQRDMQANHALVLEPQKQTRTQTHTIASATHTHTFAEHTELNICCAISNCVTTFSSENEKTRNVE